MIKGYIMDFEVQKIKQLFVHSQNTFFVQNAMKCLLRVVTNVYGIDRCEGG